MNVYQRLNSAREQFHTLKLNKSGHNKFAGYKYFELGDFLIPALKVFRENGLCATISFSPELASMVIVNTDEPSQSITITSPLSSAALKGCHEVQNLGAVETYQRRYLWVAALEIVEHDAIDAAEPTVRKIEPKGTIKATDGAEKFVADEGRRSELEQMALDWIEAHREGRDIPGIEGFYSIDDSEERVFVWKLLQAESKLRSAIKANKPQPVAA